MCKRGFPCGSAHKESACKGRPGFDPWVGKILRRRGLGNSIDCIVPGVSESEPAEQLSPSLHGRIVMVKFEHFPFDW